MLSHAFINHVWHGLTRPVVWLWPVGFLLGVTGSQVAYGWREPRLWIPDLVTGWVFISCGLIGWARRPESRSGSLLTATGFAWFAGNFVGVPGLVGWLAAHALFLHRGTLCHLLATFPNGRPASTFDRVAATLGYLVALNTVLSSNNWATITVAVLLVAACAHNYRTASGRFRRARMLSL